MQTRSSFPVAKVREQFPALSARDRFEPRVYFDNPAGTQVPLTVASAVARCLLTTNANLGGKFLTSVLAGELIDRARHAMARFFGTADASEVVFGQSMTALTFDISRCIATTLREGDEIILSRMDHDANVAPWLAIAKEKGLVVRWLPHDPETWQLSLAALDHVLSTKTKLVAVTCASNLTGSINDVRTIVDRAHAAGALVYLDAVQYAPHRRMDVAGWDCDFAVCSAYKFFGPHIGALWAKTSVIEPLPAYKVRPSKNDIPWRFEQGTPQIELVASLVETVDYLQSIGRFFTSSEDPNEQLSRAFEELQEWEDSITQQLIDGLQKIANVNVIGITQAEKMQFRAPTVAFVHNKFSSSEIAQRLADANIFVWSGYNYSLELIRSLGIDERNGVVRVGLSHYNTSEEVAKLLSLVSDL